MFVCNQTDLANVRPSPVKFTSQRPDQFPIKPEPERIPQAVADAMKHKMLSLEKLKDLPDFVKEDDDDDEVTGKLICTYRKVVISSRGYY